MCFTCRTGPDKPLPVRMKKKWFLVGLIAALVVASVSGGCSFRKETDPDRNAAERWIAQQVSGGDAGEKVHVEFEKFRCIDSTTLGLEIARRRELQETKASKESSFRDDYRRRGLRANVVRKDSSIAHCKAVLAGLDSIALSRKDQADSIVFREYEVVGTATTTSSVKRFDPIFICIAPDGTVVSSSGNLPDIHKATGKAIPGYIELLDDLKRRGI